MLIIGSTVDTSILSKSYEGLENTRACACVLTIKQNIGFFFSANSDFL